MSEARDSQVIAENRRQVERLSKLGWYHSIELPDGGVIEGHQSVENLRRRIAQFPLPDDLRGKRVLDIGAWDGWFSFEMERRGATVLAVDSAKNTRFLEARSLLGSRVEYRIADICRLTHRDVGTFDIVLFLGVLYHLKHPLLALENVCGMCRDIACIESFVTESDLHAIPMMEFYETGELRGQLDNWSGPNASCLMAFCRAAGFARVNFESALGERAHVTGYRQWSPHPTAASAPEIRCIENAATHDHSFSASADDYVTFYFSNSRADLTCDNVFPEIGPFGSRPIHVASAGGGWQATCKLPPGLSAGWHDAVLSVEGSARTAPLRIGIDLTDADRKNWPARASGAMRLRSVADGKTFEAGRVRVGPDSAITAWAENIPAADALAVRLNGTDLPAIWRNPQTGQINALLPAGLEPGPATVSVAANGEETSRISVELYR
ncbi:MAG TPA: methyltransferase domain-containing protein [Bryobacteraceae bacterium]|nr:methyltransferase domain-containing protein [Bryobacteraceae bacterium]